MCSLSYYFNLSVVTYKYSAYLCSQNLVNVKKLVTFQRYGSESEI